MLGVLLACAGGGVAFAAGSIDSVAPAEISQGDTVLLTISGSELPQGSLVVEFYPQQIAVLDILAASDSEIVVQCKVPSLAQPGDYNLLIYNQLGIEVFKEAALRVRSELFTPVFTAYSPKAFVEAEEGFALMLTGELISEEALKLLNVGWSREGTDLPALETSLALAGPGTVVAAVSGNPGAGMLRGSVKMGQTPIYLLEIEIYRAGTEIYGMSPAEVNGNAEWIAFKLIGEGLTNLSSDSLALFLSRGKRKYAAKSVSVLNDSAAQSSFPGPLEAGEYELTVERDGQPIYTTAVTVTWEESQGESIPEDLGEGQESAADGADLTGEPFERDSRIGAADGSSGEGVSGAVAQAGLTGVGESSGSIIDGLSIQEIPAGADPVRIDLLGSQLTTVVFDRLEFKLEVDQTPAELVLATSLGGQYSLIFAPRLGAWQPGSTAVLRISDPDAQYEAFESELPVADVSEQAALVETQTRPQSWEVSSLTLMNLAGRTQLEIRYSGDAAQLNPSGFSGSYSLIPRATGLEKLFTNLTTSGELSFEIAGNGDLTARAGGNFVSGSVLVRTKYLDGPQELAIAELETDPPRAVLTPPLDLRLRIDAAAGAAEPQVLGWSVDFAPLEPADPTMVVLEIPEAGEAPVSVSSYVDDTRIHFSLATAGLLAADPIPGAFTCRFSSDANLSWNREPVDRLEVELAELPAGSIQLEFAESNVELSGQGFDLSLLPSGNLPAAGRWSEVKLRSGNELLNRHIDGFMVREFAAELYGRPAVRLEFRRNSSMVSDEDYQALIDSLTGQRQVLITLSWESLGIEQTGWLTFVKSGDSAS